LEVALNIDWTTKPLTYKTNHEAHRREKILVQAKTFIIFQGDAEAITSPSPKDLTKLIEIISGPLELA
jgi:structural maintenance of chromosome 1